MRLRFAITALAGLWIIACGPGALREDQAISSAKSWMVGESAVLSVRSGPLAEMAPPGLQVTDPARRVWAITLRGTFATDCEGGPIGNLDCPPEPKTGLILLDYVDGSFIGSSVITIIPPGQSFPP